MNLELNGKVALITGSTRGIGFSIAESLYKEGCQVVLNGRNSFSLKQAIDRLEGSIGIVGDVEIPEEANKIIKEIIYQFQKIDILVCNVGSGKSVIPGEENYKEWRRVFDLNLWSATNTIEAAKKELIKNKGNIICISSICGLEVIAGAPVTYSAAKAALHAYVRGIARPLGLEGVRINAVAPGNILFERSIWSERLI